MLGSGEEVGGSQPAERPAALSWPVDLVLRSHMPIYDFERSRIPSNGIGKSACERPGLALWLCYYWLCDLGAGLFNPQSFFHFLVI